MKTVAFINLTNGIEALPIADPHFIRLQSCACEQKRWEQILVNLSDDLYINLAMGNLCKVYDFGANRPVPRSFYQGFEWVLYVLNRVWFGREVIPKVRGNYCKDYFENQFKKLSASILKRFKYYRKFLFTDELHLELISQSTSHDGDYIYYQNIMRKI